jgi:hypothetical protein
MEIFTEYFNQDHFSDKNTKITNFGKIICELTKINPITLLKLLDKISVVNCSIADVTDGIIQDPAASAVGSWFAPQGGGASGQIYDKYKLNPIPKIKICDAIFNSTNTEGKIVLHTHVPMLKGTPENQYDVFEAICSMAVAYKNTILTFLNRKCELENYTTLNLLPISSSIYSGKFGNNELSHLHPSYTLFSLLVGLCLIDINKNSLDNVNFKLCVYMKAVYESTLVVITELKQELTMC